VTTSDTPDTDSNIWSDSCEGILCKVVSAEFARRLERERDEAKIDAEQLADRLTALELHSTSELARLERERDEAREERDKLKQLLAADSENVDAYLGVCIERDEAREAAESMERAGSEQARRADANREWALKAERERDEAREEVKLLKAILDLIKKDVS
jgi:transcriptional regulator with XRE-family HTH domain